MCRELINIDWFNLTAEFVVGEASKMFIVVDSNDNAIITEVIYDLIETVDLIAELMRLGGISMVRETLDYRDMVLVLEGAVADYEDTVQRLDTVLTKMERYGL